MKILRQYEAENPGKVHVYQTEKNHHQGGAKNVGLRHVTGDWIAFIDADDWVVPDYFERLRKKAEETGADCVGTDYSLVSTHTFTPGERVANSRMDQTGVLTREKKKSLMLDFGSLCVKIYRKEIILGCPSRFPEDIFYEDNALAKTWIFRMHHFAYIPEPLYFYYQHGDSTVHTVNFRRLEDRKIAGEIMLSESVRYEYFWDFRDEIEYAYTVLYYKNTLFSCLQERLGKGSYAFVTRLAAKMKQTFPDFQKNPYYIARTDAEQKKLIAMQMASPRRFYVYYRLLALYRRIRYGRKNR
jgi:glycosyltransferase EpsH